MTFPETYPCGSVAQPNCDYFTTLAPRWWRPSPVCFTWRSFSPVVIVFMPLGEPSACCWRRCRSQGVTGLSFLPAWTFSRRFIFTSVLIYSTEDWPNQPIGVINTATQRWCLTGLPPVKKKRKRKSLLFVWLPNKMSFKQSPSLESLW